ncbi:MAG: FecR domain-containing protein [Siphonobacter sp.]
MNDQTRKVLIRYFEGNCTEEEACKIEQWLQEDPAHAHWVEEILKNEPVWVQVQEAEEEVQRRIKDQIAKEKLKVIPLARIRSVGVVIGVVLIVGLAGWWHYTANRFTTLQTRFGQQMSCVLPDQTKVRLNGNSKLRFQGTLRRGIREVWLEGEAFFEVQHTQKDQPFILHLSGNDAIEVLGTEFNVFSRQGRIETVLKSGKIKYSLSAQDSVRWHSSSLYLKPGDRLQRISHQREILTSNVNPEMYYSWINGKWILNDDSLESILRKIKDNYGIQIKVQYSSLLRREAYGSLPLPDSGQSVGELLESIADLYELTIVRSRDEILLTDALEKK